MKRRGQTEHSKIQCAIVDGCIFHPEARKIFHIPNEGKMSRIAGYWLNREGRTKGVADLFLPVARGGFHGAYGEVKIPGDDLTDEQREFRAQVLADGYYFWTAWSAQQGIDEVLCYLGLPK